MTTKQFVLDVKTHEEYHRSWETANKALTLFLASERHVIVSNMVKDNPVSAFLLGLNIAFNIAQQALQKHQAPYGVSAEIQQSVDLTGTSIAKHIQEQRGTIQ